jgi:ABC-type Fe3+-siderophore transport system permease subunit
MSKLLQLMVLDDNDAFTLGLNIKLVYFVFFTVNGCWDGHSDVHKL